MTVQQPVDSEKIEAFAGQVLGYFNSTAITFMLSIGNQTGLFDTMSTLPPATSEQIAAAAGLNERYVREWLGSLVTGGVITYDAAAATYSLPPEHAASLTRAAGPGNLATMAQHFPMLAQVEPAIVECFRNGGGVAYPAFQRFQTLMQQDSAQVFDATLVDVSLPMAPGLVEDLRRGIAVADVGCGAGHAINLMARNFPNSSFTGYDLSEEGIRMAREEAHRWGLTNARFEVRDAATLDMPETYDLITTFDAIHDQAHPDRVLRGIHESLKPRGVYLCVDVAASSNLEENLSHPIGPSLYMFSVMHCMTVSLAYGGMGLGTVWGSQKAIEMLGEAGFKNIEVKQVEGDFFNNYYLARK